MTLPTYIANKIIDVNLHTRIHPIFTYRENTYVKREDELSAGIVGSKYRKYASIVSFLQCNNYQEIVIIGGENSNNVVGLLQLLNENGFRAKLFLLRQNHSDLQGNSLWLRLLHEEKQIKWLNREQWANVQLYAEEYTRTQSHRCCILPEGGNHPYAIWGAMTLAFDIVANENKHNIEFSSIFIDSGTGVSAIAMILGFAVQNQQRDFHITLIAGNPQYFLKTLQYYNNYVSQVLSQEIHIDPHRIFFHRPPTAKSFGAVNSTVLHEVTTLARTTGILVDPVYSAKHFMTVKQIKETSSPSLIVFNGSAFGLVGFQPRLSKQFR